jgi:hypothetical protein
MSNIIAIDGWNNQIQRGDIVLWASRGYLRLGIIRKIEIRYNKPVALVNFTSPALKNLRRLGIWLYPEDIMKTDKERVKTSYYPADQKQFLLELHEEISGTTSPNSPSCINSQEDWREGK